MDLIFFFETSLLEGGYFLDYGVFTFSVYI